MAFENNTPNVVAVGASAGGVEALRHFAAGLPPGLPYAVLVVLHMSTGAPSVLARILSRHGPLPAAQAVDGEPLEPGTIRVTVPIRHLLVDHHRIALSEGPTENGYRPAINALFRSVALAFGHRAVSVLLSGVLDDGALGSAAVRSRGGTTIAQSPADALFPALSRRLAGQVTPWILSERYEAIAEETEDAMAALGNRLSEIYSKQREADE